MSFKEWALSQFEVKIIKTGKYKGKICFKTPLYNYTMNPELWGEIKKKLNEV